jgi:DNA-binding LytR/AlgR family response regulator
VNRAPTALIAEDEPLLARALERQLKQLWPELQVLAHAADGPAAVAAALAQRPQLLFLDIQMPGATGLEAAAEIADEWPEDEAPPLIVFVTAFDQFALAAFERAAVDYVLKPVTPERLALTVARLQERLAARAAAGAAGAAPARDASAALVRSVQAATLTGAAAHGSTGHAIDGTHAAGAPGQASARASGQPDDGAEAPAEKIRIIRAAQGAQGQRVVMIPLAEVLCFEAADKYVRVITEASETGGTEALLRLSLRDLAQRLEGVEFTQVHRSVMVQAARIAGAERDEAGHYWLSVRGLKRPLKVSRAFSHLFRPM